MSAFKVVITLCLLWVSLGLTACGKSDMGNFELGEITEESHFLKLAAASDYVARTTGDIAAANADQLASAKKIIRARSGKLGLTDAQIDAISFDTPVLIETPISVQEIEAYWNPKVTTIAGLPYERQALYVNGMVSSYSSFYLVPIKLSASQYVGFMMVSAVTKQTALNSYTNPLVFFKNFKSSPVSRLQAAAQFASMTGLKYKSPEYTANMIGTVVNGQNGVYNTVDPHWLMTYTNRATGQQFQYLTSMNFAGDPVSSVAAMQANPGYGFEVSNYNNGLDYASVMAFLEGYFGAVAARDSASLGSLSFDERIAQTPSVISNISFRRLP